MTREAQERVAAQMQASDAELQSVVNASEAQVGALESWANAQYGESASELLTQREESAKYHSAAVQFEQESEMMSHQEDRLLLVENDTMHDTMIRDLLNSKPTVKGKQMKQSSNFSASAELAKALSLAQNGNGNEQ